MALRAFIVDDEPGARRRLRQMLQRHEDVEIAGEFAAAEEARAVLLDAPPDLVFLDIQMPAEDGFSLLSGLDPSAAPVVIFVTAHERHAVRAFEVDAVDYLLKPFDEQRFDQALRRAREALLAREHGELAKRISTLVDDDRRRERYPDRLAIRETGRVNFLPIREIAWIDAAHNRVRLHGAGASHFLREPIGEIERRLDPEKFVRVHRSTLVNVDHVREMLVSPTGQYLLVLASGQRLSVSRSHRDRIRDRFGLKA